MVVSLFNNDELSFISDKSFFERKAEVSSKVINQLNELQKELKNLVNGNNLKIPESVLTSTPKISRGENYKGFPWMVLDYPRVFNPDEIFAFRTLFWWGHSWVLTFQLSGNFINRYRSGLFSRLHEITDADYKIGIGTNPWIHNPDDPMYLYLTELVKRKNAGELLQSQSFFKLVRKIDFKESDKLIGKALLFYSSCLDLLSA